jgi:penicillin-binding protein 1C
VWAARVPYDRAALDFADVASVRVVARDGATLRVLVGGGGTRAEWVALQDISPRLVQATLAAEDRRFLHHMGIDPLSTAAAVWKNLCARRYVRGGSTLTQQLAGMLWPEPRTLPGKLREAVRAVRLEADLSKDEILEQYLNRVPCGPGAQGVAVACARYFGRTAGSVDAAQAATLAALPKAPGRYTSDSARGALKARRDRILAAMARHGDVQTDECARAQAAPVELRRDAAPFAAPHFSDWVLETRPQALRRARRIETTLDPALQAEIEGIVATELEQLRGQGVGQIAAVVLGVEGGEVLAMVGSPAWGDPNAGQVNGALAPRQPGSALKPFLYAAAFASGVSPADLMADVPLHLLDASGADVAPRNYDSEFHGPVRAREALASSFNVPAVRLQQEIGTERVLSCMRRAGLESLSQDADFYGLGLTLGVGEVTLLDLANAYAGLARGGVWREPVTVRGASDANSRPIPLPRPAERRWLDPETAFLVADVLADDAARIPGLGAHSALDLPFPVAVKTGTSTDYRNSWCIGFTRDHVVGIWAGNFDGSPIFGLAGVRCAGPVFREVMTRVVARGSRPWEAAPPRGWTRRPVCALSGAVPGEACGGAVLEWFAPGAYEKRSTCTFHSLLDGKPCVVWPPEYVEWAHEHDQDTANARSTGDMASRGNRIERAEGSVGARIVSPQEGSVYYRDPRLAQDGGIRFAAQVPEPSAGWILDGRRLVPPDPGGALFWRPEPGEHVLELVSSRGRDRVRFTVR